MASGGLLSSCGAGASHSSGPPCCGAWARGMRASVVVAPGLWSTGSVAVTQGLSCPGACGIFPDQGSMSPALAGGFFTTKPPGKPYRLTFIYNTATSLSLILLRFSYIVTYQYSSLILNDIQILQSVILLYFLILSY